MILGDSYITFSTKLSNFREHYVPLESKFRGHLKQKQAKSPFLRDRENPALIYSFASHYISIVHCQMWAFSRARNSKAVARLDQNMNLFREYIAPPVRRSSWANLNSISIRKGQLRTFSTLKSA